MSYTHRPRAGSQVRFAEHPSYSPSPRQDLYDIPPNSPQPPPRSAMRSSISRQSSHEPSFDAIQRRLQAIPYQRSYHPSHQGQERISAVPFSPNLRRPDHDPEDRRGSDETLTDAGDWYANKSYPQYQPHDFHKPSVSSTRDIEAGTIAHEGQGGFFNHIRQAFAQFAHDHEQHVSRPNSRAGSRRTSVDGYRSDFQRALAINADCEETYLYDDDDRTPRRRHRLPPVTPSKPDGIEHKSYQERRKREKHTIKFCAESLADYHTFSLVFAKALLTFGSPSHRIEAQLNSLAKFFTMEAQFHHTAGTVQVCFGSPESNQAETCLIKAPVGLALGRIHAVHNIYRKVLHDDMYASRGTRELKKLLDAPPRYGQKTRLVLSYICCMLICGIAFGGSVNDMWLAGFMGLLVRVMQNIAAKSQLSASGSEVFTAALVSLIARAASSVTSKIWCFTAVSSAGVISLLPGYLILSGSLDIAGKNPSLGSPKIVSGILTSLYLGFGLTLGSDVFLFLDKPARSVLTTATKTIIETSTLTGAFEAVNATDPTNSFTGTFTFTNQTVQAVENIVQGCYRDPSWAWYLQPLPTTSLFLLVPLFAFFSSMNNQQHWWSRQMLVMVGIACVSFFLTRVANQEWGLSNHPDYVSLLGSWAVGLLGNGYSRRFGGTAFVCMLTGILLLVPDGLSAAGGLAQNYQVQGEDEYTESLTLARKMISVIIGIMAGVYSSAAMIYFFGKKKNAALVTF